MVEADHLVSVSISVVPAQELGEYRRGMQEALEMFCKTGEISFMKGINSYCRGYNESMECYRLVASQCGVYV